MSLTLTPAEIERLTGYSAKRPADQLREMHKQGYYRARRGRRGTGPVIVERIHVEAIKAGLVPAVPITVERSKPRDTREFPWDKETALYRHFDKAGVLLYVGIAVDPARRSGDHMREQPWAKRSARVDIEWFPSRREALAAESAAIRSEHPKYNVLHKRRADAESR